MAVYAWALEASRASLKGLILDILQASATKRDARAYLNRFGPQKVEAPSEKTPPTIAKTAGVNVGDFFSPMRAAIDKNPALTSHAMKDKSLGWKEETLHVALIKIRSPECIEDATLRGVLHSLEQLSCLGMQSVVVIDCDDHQIQEDIVKAKRLVAQQADRIVETIDGLRGKGARRLDSIISISSHSKAQMGGHLRVSHRPLVLSPLRKGMMPVIAPIGFNPTTAKYEAIPSDEVVLALAKEFAGISTMPQWEEDDDEVARKIKLLQSEISLDRIIVLDPLGGTPYHHQPRAHRFINLEQEYDGLTTAFFKSQNPDALRHGDNLTLMKAALDLLPPSSSGFITTPSAVAQSDNIPSPPSSGPAVSTRKQRNPLIHNLLTDKPAVSFSLPQHRLDSTSTAAMGNVSTLLKRGMSLTIVPKLPVGGWTCPTLQHPNSTNVATLGLRDPRIDYQRLTYLINDSFRRTLDVKAYDERTRNTLAGVMIAGDYQGAAIFTWEQPPSAYNVGGQNYPWIPYLDKFAVLRSAQGTATADVLWNAMTKAFPHGFCWRSRTVNPVNKWYFERSKGSWELPGTQWTMFWSKTGVFDEADQKHWKGFLGVCLSVEPSWMDHMAVD